MTTNLPKQPTRNGVCAACGLLVAHHYSARTGRQLDCIEARGNVADGSRGAESCIVGVDAALRW